MFGIKDRRDMLDCMLGCMYYSDKDDNVLMFFSFSFDEGVV